jgi:hypothetical protein
VTTGPFATPEETSAALAEFSALRQEILFHMSAQQNLYLFQLAAAGSILSFAVTGAGRGGSALIVPVLS